MLLALFRNNSLPALLLYVFCALGFGYSTWQGELDLLPYSFISFSLSDAFAGFSWLLPTVLVILIAFLFQGLVVRINLYEKSTALPLFVLTFGLYLFPNSGLLPGILFTLLAFFSLLRQPGKFISSASAFYSGFFLGLASIVCLPLLWLLVLLPFAQPLFGRFPVRFFLITLLSYCIPWVYMVFWHDITSEIQFWPVWWSEQISFVPGWTKVSVSVLVNSIFILGTLAIAVFYFLQSSGRLKIFQRTSYYAFALFFWGLIPAIVFRPVTDLTFVSFIAFPYAAFVCYWLLNVSRVWVSDLVLLLLFTLVLLSSLVGW
jgi:hypothetical protein